jgi:hypothetical protein
LRPAHGRQKGAAFWATENVGINERLTLTRICKEATGSLVEEAITSIRERPLSLADLDQLREAILKSLTGRCDGLWSD